MPTATGLVLAALITGTYILSLADRNPWLASLAVSGLVWLFVSLSLTHRLLVGLNLTTDGRIVNLDDEPKHGLHIDGAEIAELAAYGSIKIQLSPHVLRYRISSFNPTGLFYAWRFQKTKRLDETQLNEGTRYVPGSPLARVDWKHWIRRGRLTATPLDPNFRLRPSEELRPADLRVWSPKTRLVTSDAALWALIWSFFVVLTLGAASLYFASLWAGIIFFAWIAASVPGFFVSQKFRYWGRINFFFAWIILTLVIVAAKARIEPWMISTSSLAILFIPFGLHLKLSGANNLLKRLRAILGIAILTIAVLYSVRSIIARQFRFGAQYYAGGNLASDVTWGASLSSATLRSADYFLVRGQGIFWVNYSHAEQLAYRWKLPYWRESTYSETRAGLNWSGKMLAADAGRPIEANLFLPGREALQLQREPPTSHDSPAITANDKPPTQPYFIYSLKVRELAKSLNLDPTQPLVSADKIIAWLKRENFRYSLRPGRMNDIDEFLFRKKIGLCQHYAAAVAFILRAANIPARVVAGYQGGEVDESNETLLMHDYEAHAWVEVWTPVQKGWTLVDPTAALFPNEFQAMPGGARLARITRAVVSLQSRWAKLQSHLSILFGAGLGFFIALALLVYGLSRFRRTKSAGRYLSPPEVREWEKRMHVQFGGRRFLNESLKGYYLRMASKTKKVKPAERRLQNDLEILERKLYQRT